MRFFCKPLLCALATFTLPAFAQNPALSTGGIVEIGANYDFLNANAPAGQCGCFSANGGSGTVTLNLLRSFSLVADLSGVQANNANKTTQNLTLFHYLAGGRYTLHTHSRLALYGQALTGVSHESSSYSFAQSQSAFAFALGGGAKAAITHHFGITLLQADWVHSDLSNGENNRQNDVRLGTGIYASFGTK